jgi:hypothetical protein
MKMSKYREGDAGRLLLRIQLEGMKPDEAGSKPN